MDQNPDPAHQTSSALSPPTALLSDQDPQPQPQEQLSSLSSIGNGTYFFPNTEAQSSAPVPTPQQTTSQGSHFHPKSYIETKLTIDVPPLPSSSTYPVPMSQKKYYPRQKSKHSHPQPQVSFSNYNHQSWYNFDQKTFAEYQVQLQETDTDDGDEQDEEDYFPFPVEMQEPRFLPFDHDERMEAARISNLGMMEPTGIYLHNHYQQEQQIPIQTSMFSYENEEDLLDHYQEMEELQLQAQGFIPQNQAAVLGSSSNNAYNILPQFDSNPHQSNFQALNNGSISQLFGSVIKKQQNLQEYLAMLEIAEDELVKTQQLHKLGKEKLEKQEIKDAEEPEVEQKVKIEDKPKIEDKEKPKQEEKNSKVNVEEKVEAGVASPVNISEYDLQLVKQEMPYNYVSIDDLSESESGFGFRFGDGSGTGDFVDISLSDEHVGVSGTKADGNLGIRKSIFGVLIHGIHRRLSGILPSCLKKGAKGHGPPIINPRFMNSL